MKEEYHGTWIECLFVVVVVYCNEGMNSSLPIMAWSKNPPSMPPVNIAGTAKNDAMDNIGKPEIPWPEVQPFASREPKSIKNPPMKPSTGGSPLTVPNELIGVLVQLAKAPTTAPAEKYIGQACKALSGVCETA